MTTTDLDCSEETGETDCDDDSDNDRDGSYDCDDPGSLGEYYSAITFGAPVKCYLIATGRSACRMWV